ncbi:putative FAD-linked oxidoreductase [bioreactor metagenome]|uniref:Putative FAD-linked oxidoreductase n=1 Tax=bioreactor metagenome TaxID=1076179 RepID=A0A645I5N2_9ZZZZ
MHDEVVDAIDASIPMKNLPKYMKGVKAISEKYNIVISTIGHIGDGNMHNSILNKGAVKPDNYEELADELFKLVVECDGALTGEHGIGKVRNNKINLQFSEIELLLMREIKKVFDPNNILNPGTAL